MTAQPLPDATTAPKSKEPRALPNWLPVKEAREALSVAQDTIAAQAVQIDNHWKRHSADTKTIVHLAARVWKALPIGLALGALAGALADHVARAWGAM
jgi:hypothetical protein